MQFTKEQLITRANHMLCVGKAFLAEHPEYDGMSKDVELFGIALSSLNANPVYQYRERPYSEWMECSERYYQVAKEMNAEFTRILFTAPPASAVPDGYALVPIEPTESMIVDGFESEPDKFFSKPEEWKAYEAMSGCQQAAHRAKLCWAAMLAAAPKPE